MQRLALKLCYLCLSLVAQTVYADRNATLTKTYERIIQLEDARTLGNGELEALLQHKLPEVRYRAALAIGRIGDKRGTDALLKVLEKELLTRLRLITVFALGEMEDVEAVQALVNVLERKTEAVAVRARAAEALGKIVISQDNAMRLGKEFVEKINSALIAQ
ncbi:MAG TPA: HEAT repeat domain-containing protein, partial [Blastocatellia bacterium]|nr:HEAT repeat domain-containing protein [Blastocatellia bacterium]